MRAPVHRFVVIVDERGRVVAREDLPAHTPFLRYSAPKLPEEVVLLARRAVRKQTHLLSSGCLMHVVPFSEAPDGLTALIFEELRLRSGR